MRTTLTLTSHKNGDLIEITALVAEQVELSGVSQGICSLFLRATTAGLLLQGSWDGSVAHDIKALFQKLVPPGVWEHDRLDGNGDAHLKAALVGPSITIPIYNGKLDLSEHQAIWLCEFDGPRLARELVVTIIKDHL